jgi:hypothetical protein
MFYVPVEVAEPVPPSEHDTPWMRAVVEFRNAKFDYGQMITTKWFCAAAGIEYPGDSMKKQFIMLQEFNKFAHYLATVHTMHLRAMRGKATGHYVILRPSEQANVADKELTYSVGKAFRKATFTLRNVDIVALSDKDRIKLRDTAARVASLRRAVKKAFKYIPAGKMQKSLPQE